MKKTIFSFLILLFCLTGLSAQSVAKIFFQGNNSFSSSQLEKQLTLKSESLFNKIGLKKSKDSFHKYILDDDEGRLINFYQKQGFLSVDIHSEVEHSKKNNSVAINFIINEHEPVFVDSICFYIKSSLQSDSLLIRNKLNSLPGKFPLQKNRRFSDQELYSTQEMIKRALADLGFPFAKIQRELQLNKQRTRVQVFFKVISEKRYRFGKIRIEGNKRISNKFILENNKLHCGDWFSEKPLEKTQREIQNLGLFRIVTVKPLLEQSVADSIAILINVRENLFFSSKLGVGYGLEDRLRLSAKLQKLRFLGGIRQFNFLVKYSHLLPYDLNAVFIQPSFLGKSNELLVNPYLRKKEESAFTLKQFGSNFSFQVQPTSEISSSFNYNFEQDYLQMESSDSAAVAAEGYYNKSGFTIGFAYDNTKPSLFPKGGVLSSLVATISGIGFNSRYHYLKFLYNLNKFQSISDGLVFSSRLKIGWMRPISGDKFTPIEDRFFAGGRNSLRGWKRSEVGPKNADNSPIGGNSYFETNFGLRIHIWKMIYSGVFTDIGNVWSKSDYYNFKDLYYDVGFGIYVKIPIGPIRIEVATPFWNEKEKIQFHLSIGQVF